MRRSGRRAATGLLLSWLLLALSACSGSGDEAAPKPQEPQEPSSSSASPTQSPSPTTSPKASPLSRFEDEPTVVVTRKVFAAAARDVNARRRDLPTAAPLLTREGVERFRGYAAEDMGLYYPGPLPFTPVAVEVTGKTAAVKGCFLLNGFAQDRRTKLPARKRDVSPNTVRLRREGGTWKVERLVTREGSCEQVAVKGVAW